MMEDAMTPKLSATVADTSGMTENRTPCRVTVTTYDGYGNLKPTSPEVQQAWQSLSEAFHAETDADHVGPAPRRKLSAREQRAELATAIVFDMLHGAPQAEGQAMLDAFTSVGL